MAIAAYLRISVDEEIGKDNTSIENQKSIISAYAAQKFPDDDIEYFEDRDRSGYTFEQREGYQYMRRGLMSGKYTILIIKDFSRFSRRNSRGLAELEDLRDAGVRIISINDGIDFPTCDEWLQIQFRFLINEMPVTDTSKKVSKVIENRQKEGRWICAVPYGYTMTDSKAMKFEVNEKQAEVIRMIYDMYLSGMGYKAISNKLTEMNIPTARQDEILRCELMGKSTRLRGSSRWSSVTVSQILSNDFYIGTLRQHKYSRKKINGDDILLPAAENIVIENDHTPIVTKAVFEQAQQQLAVRTRSNYRGVKKYRTDYTGFLICGDCGRPMSSMSRPDLAPAYRCSTYTKHGKAYCSSHHIRVDRLDDTLKKVIEKLRDNSTLIAEILDKQLAARERKNISDDTPEQINRQISQLKAELAAVTTQRIRDIMANPTQEKLINETYDSIISSHSQKIEGLNAQLELLAKRDKAVADTNKAAATTVEVLDEILAKEKLDKTDIGSIIDNIQVYEDHITVNLLTDIDGIIKAEAELAEPQKRLDTSIDDCVTVVSEGDPLEIYTSSDGEVIFKKYSAINEMAASASQVAEVMTKLANCPTVVFDRDHVVAVAGVGKKEFSERRVSQGLEDYLEHRKNYIYSSADDVKVFPVEGIDRAAIACTPILSSGDVTGAVAFLAPASGENTAATEVQKNLIQAAAQFLGKQIEE